MDTIESNKLIAEFMGIKLLNTYGQYAFPKSLPQFKHSDHSEWCNETKDNLHYPLSASLMDYHNSWDWLMPVVRKIVEICIDDGTDQYFKTNWDLFESASYTSILETIPLAIIEDSYKVVVEFIKYYNKQKQ